MSARKWLALQVARRRIRGIPDPRLNELCTTLKDGTNADSAFVSFVTAKRAYVVGEADVPPQFINKDGVELQQSFCAHLVGEGSDGLVIDNTREFPLLEFCPTTATFGSWVGAPIHFRGEVIGAFGVAGFEPRHWPTETLAQVQKSAADVADVLGS